MVANKCCVHGCTATGVTRHRFPNPKVDLKRYQRWLEILSIEELFTLHPENVYSRKRVCFAHFEQRYKSPGNSRLHRNAIPFIKISDTTKGGLKRTATNIEDQILSKRINLDNELNSEKHNILTEINLQQPNILQTQSQIITSVNLEENSSDDEIKISETIRRLALLKKDNCIGVSSKMSEEVGSLLQKAVALDSKDCYSEAVIYYQKGIELLCDSMTNESNETKKNYFKNKIKEYLGRAEKLKQLLKEQEKYHEQIIIGNNSTGHSYEKIFKKFLDSDVETVKIEDPYIRMFHQCQNLLMLCELLVKNCRNLKKIFLITTQSLNQSEALEQQKWMDELKESLITYKISFDITYSSTLHDRQISFSNGWIVKIGRGLDYFKKPLGKFSLGNCDYDLRQCFETTIDIFHQKNLKQSFG